MESTPSSPDRTETRAALLEAERAAAAPYVDYPATPRWYPPAVGAWATAFAALALVDVGRWDSLARAGLTVIVVLFLAWYRRQRGTMPSMRNVPAEFRTAFWQYLAGCAALVAIFLASGKWLPLAATLPLMFVLVTGATYAWERRYARAAAETRARLS
jgi:hypothetical protein